MKLTDITKPGFDKTVWEQKGYNLPQFDIQELRKKTFAKPTWIHFGAGNLFRAFPAAVLQKILNAGKYDRGVIVVGGYDTEAIQRNYHDNDCLSILTLLKADGTIEKSVIASVTEALRLDPNFLEDKARLIDIFQNPSLQMVSFTITEKGYSPSEEDLALGINALRPMGKVAALLLKRFEAGAYPITLQSMDNCARNGDVVRDAITTYAKRWIEEGIAPKRFLEYLEDQNLVSYPWSMIDKITPKPNEVVLEALCADGISDVKLDKTSKGTLVSPFVNAEDAEYLVLEDTYTNGRPPLELGGVIYSNRDTVELVEKMKVGTCLNPLHTAMSIFGCLLCYSWISEEMKDADIVALITKMAYNESLPVVKDPGLINPKDFLDTVLTKRLPNPFLPDAPQRIAEDTSQKIPVRFGETIKVYLKQGLDLSELTLIPLVFAAYARYLRGIDDNGNEFTLSPDPKLEELCAIVSELEVTDRPQDMSCLRKLFSQKEIFGVDLYSILLGEKLEKMTSELYSGIGAVRKTLNSYVN